MILTTDKSIEKASDYEGPFGYKQRTIFGVTWSSGFDSNNNITTEGIGVTGTVSFPKLNFGLLNFGFGAGATTYKMISAK